MCELSANIQCGQTLEWNHHIKIRSLQHPKMSTFFFAAHAFYQTLEFVGKLAVEANTTVPDGCPFAPILKFALAREKAEDQASIPSVVDARRVGNDLRFITPSCHPNCESALWRVNGHPRLVVQTLKQSAWRGWTRHKKIG